MIVDGVVIALLQLFTILVPIDPFFFMRFLHFHIITITVVVRVGYYLLLLWYDMLFLCYDDLKALYLVD